jgi:hypothetical protein
MSKKQSKPTETKPEEMIVPKHLSKFIVEIEKLPYAYQCVVSELREIKELLAVIASPPKQ